MMIKRLREVVGAISLALVLPGCSPASAPPPAEVRQQRRKVEVNARCQNALSRVLGQQAGRVIRAASDQQIADPNFDEEVFGRTH